jgi:arylsulfatase A-like enzyme
MTPTTRRAPRTPWLACGLLLAAAAAPAQEAPARPNIVYILADDLGIGDVRAYNPEGKIPTPHHDRVAREGMRFTDAHSGSAVCTPTRYGILTGRYAWRTRLARSVIGGYSPPLIEPGRMTVASLLKKNGYRTAAVGKWHLGIGWPRKPGAVGELDDWIIPPEADPWSIDFARPFRGGPTDHGFDAFYGISGTADMPPFVFLAGDRCAGVPSVEKTFLRTGPAEKSFEVTDVMPKITDKAVATLDAWGKDPKARPFFLYFAMTAPHTPIAPSRDYAGRSEINAYADFVIELDDAVGRVLEALDRNGLADSTLLIVTSDNGCSPAADYPTLLAHGHNPSGPYRGWKADIFEGGHRIPLLVRWPGRVEAGSTCDQTACLTDLMATCADLLGDALPDDAGEDSVSLLPALLGEARAPLREATVHHSIDGSFAIRRGRWKLCLCPGSGGWSRPEPGGPEEARLPAVQLYDLEADPAERRNVQADHPEVVAELTRLLERYVARGRSTPGEPQANDRPVGIGPGGTRR